MLIASTLAFRQMERLLIDTFMTHKASLLLV
jgi:hypothetical protein